MKAEYSVYSALEDIHFKYERLKALISILQQYTAECVEIAGAPDNVVEHSLYEIEMGMQENNEKLKEIILNGGIINEKQEKKSA